MRKSTVGRRLAGGFGAVLLVLCAMGITTSVVMYHARDTAAEVARVFIPEARLATAFEREILNARIHFIYHVTIQKAGALDKGWSRFAKARELVPQLLQQIEKPKLAHLRASTEQLSTDFLEYESELNRILKLVETRQNSGAAFAEVLNSWAARGGRLVDTAGKLSSSATGSAEKDCEDQATRLTQTVQLTIAGCVGASLLGMVIALLLTRSVKHALKQAVGRVYQAIQDLAAASDRLASASRSLAEGATEQAASVEATSASCEEISTIARRSSDSARLLFQNMSTSEQQAQSGMTALDQMLGSIDEVLAGGESVFKTIKVIDEIAFQTRILSLNAAVEAARAGAAGVGFAVVAEEVGNLAHRSTEAARQTAELIGTSAEKTAAGRSHIREVESIIRQLVVNAAKASEMANQVSTSSAEQTAGLEHIAGAITQVEGITHRVSAGAEECAASVTEIASQADSMKKVAANLASLIG